MVYAKLTKYMHKSTMKSGKLIVFRTKQTAAVRPLFHEIIYDYSVDRLFAVGGSHLIFVNLSHLER